MNKRIVYLDHAATTPLAPEVLEVMLPYFSLQAGNPSSIHQLGRAALHALDDAREQVALVLGCTRREVIFTSGGSEGANLALKGVALAQRARGRGAHLIVSAIEHHAVLHAAEALQTLGFELTLLPVDRNGLVQPSDLQTALRPDTVLVSVMYANNEVGSIQPIPALGAICRAAGVFFHSDAVQAAGALPLDVETLHVDLLSLTGHKCYGPKGVGVLYARRGIPLQPQINGGGQERRRRAGTENVPGIVGFAAALSQAEAQRGAASQRLSHLRDHLITKVLGTIPDSWLNGDPTQRLPNNANLGFAGIEGESLLLLLDQVGICASSGSACTSGSLEPSHVLVAMGLTPEAANGSVRFTLGQTTTSDEVAYLLEVLPPMIARLREVSQ
ncbi:cysteine desulfurase family protein [Candidatus Viridilinea mediisalina]|uniref:cysteine desulfurase n=1 Tax=Candidatus Viridilinea mediisalina TaxID=2024553 RepID=A0A2A6RPS8_9CHLR|nr:cysteine desulfurase family protein [Candidatus Viridilinea mediisalina]PDW04901.1 cysteine desulfurase NifS [Candidatus Viridilinea mediisalina]